MSTGGVVRIGDWFREWRLPLKRFLMRRRAGSAADIDDIAQEVFLRLLRYNRAELVDSPQAYLYKIAANVSAEWSSQASRRMPHDSAWLVDLADALQPDAEFDRQSRFAQIEAADRRREPLFRRLRSPICLITRIYEHEALQVA